MHAVITVFDHPHVQAVEDREPVFGQNRPRLGDESGLERIILPAGGEEIGEGVSFFSHGILR